MLIKGDISKGSYNYLLMDTKSTPFFKQWKGPDISYNINGQGYRCNEWEAINWNESIIVFGASNVFGVGVSECQTLSSAITSLTNTPAVNLGQPATSPAFQWVNSMLLLNKNIKPKGVVYVWPNEFRHIEFTDHTGTHLKNIGNWSKTNYIKQWISHPYQAEMSARHYIDAIKLSWNCPSAHFRLPQSDPNSPLLEIDQSRDRQHPGPKSYQLWAECAVKELLLQGF